MREATIDLRRRELFFPDGVPPGVSIVHCSQGRILRLLHPEEYRLRLETTCEAVAVLFLTAEAPHG
jgi:hypothetical protein